MEAAGLHWRRFRPGVGRARGAWTEEADLHRWQRRLHEHRFPIPASTPIPTPTPIPAPTALASVVPDILAIAAAFTVPATAAMVPAALAAAVSALATAAILPALSLRRGGFLLGGQRDDQHDGGRAGGEVRSGASRGNRLCCCVHTGAGAIGRQAASGGRQPGRRRDDAGDADGASAGRCCGRRRGRAAERASSAS